MSRRLTLSLLGLAAFCLTLPPVAADDLPPLVTSAQVDKVKRAQAWLAAHQLPDGSWSGNPAGHGGYPIAMTSVAGLALLSCGNTPTRGPYAPHVRKAVEFLLTHQDPTGVYESASEMRNMHGHGYAMTFLAEVYGMTGSQQGRGTGTLQDRLRESLIKAIQCTQASQTPQGGFGYQATPSQGDEGSVTVTQIQGLRACMNAGIEVPGSIIEKSYQYLADCQSSDGGIAYSYATRSGGSRPALTAAAVATLYSQSRESSPVTDRAWHYIEANGLIRTNIEDPRIQGFFMYSHFYIAQVAFIRGGDEWNQYFGLIRENLIAKANGDGSWQGEGGAGLVFGTSLAVIILQLPYKQLMILNR